MGEEKWSYKSLPVEILKGEEHLQRPYDAKHAQRIIADFEEGLVNPILVSARPNGNGFDYIAINGQHTRTVLREKKIQYVMCRIGYGLTREREKELFAKVDTYFKSRNKASQTVYEINAGTGTGDEINDILIENGYDYKLVNCLGTLRDLYQKSGSTSFKAGLVLYKALYGDYDNIHSNVFGGIVMFVDETPAYNIDKLRKALSELAGRISTPKEVAANASARNGNASYTSIKSYLNFLYSKRRRK